MNRIIITIVIAREREYNIFKIEKKNTKFQSENFETSSERY